MELAIDVVDAGAVGLGLGHGVEHAGRPHGVDDCAGAAAVDDAELLLPRRRLARVVHDLDGAVGGVGDTGKLADHQVHVAGGVLDGGVMRDQRVEAGDADLIVGNGANDGGGCGLVDVRCAAARHGDLDRHGDAAGDKQPTLELVLVDS